MLVGMRWKQSVLDRKSHKVEVAEWRNANCDIDERANSQEVR